MICGRYQSEYELVRNISLFREYNNSPKSHPQLFLLPPLPISPYSLSHYPSHLHAMSDPVAAKSTFLCMYMSNHPDTLVSYVRYWGKVQEKVVSAQMTAIDTKVKLNT